MGERERGTPTWELVVKRVRIVNPFRDGMVTDFPAFGIGERNSVFAQDLVAPEGIARQRKGWEYVDSGGASTPLAFDVSVFDGLDVFTGDALVAATNLNGIFRNKFILSGFTRTVVTGANGNAYVHRTADSGIAVATVATAALPRCVYNDELIICSQDGTTGIKRYSGALFNTDTVVTVAGYTAGRSTMTATTGLYAAQIIPGSYVALSSTAGANRGPLSSVRVLENVSTTVLSIEGVKATLTAAAGGSGATGSGVAFPCVNVYSAGTGTFTANTFVGSGTKWSGGGWGTVTSSDALLALRPTGTSNAHLIASVTNATTLALTATDKTDTDINYAILRGCPFKDAAAHNGSFWGTGVAQYPNNVYVGPPGWNLSFPPGFILPYDPTVLPGSTNANDFLMDSIAVPSAYDGDLNVAILASPNPLLVLKRSAAYGIFGSFPNFSVSKIADGMGCIDIRSAISGPSGQFWAGEDGIYAYVGGRIIDLTDGKINREWRALTRSFDYGVSDYCTIGEIYNHLLVSIVTSSGATNRCYVYDLRNKAWISRFTNHKARAFFSSPVTGERREAYWVGDSQQGRIMRSAVTLNAAGIAKDADATSPRMQAWTGEGLDADGIVDSDSRMLDLSVSTNVFDVGAAGATKLGVSVVTGGSLEAGASATKTLTDISSDAVAAVDRTRYRTVNAKGRRHQVRVDVNTLGTDDPDTKVEIHEIDVTFRGRRDRS